MSIHAHKIGIKVPRQNLQFHFPPIHMLNQYFFHDQLTFILKNRVDNHMSANLKGTNNIYKNGTMDNIHFKATFAATVDIGHLIWTSPNSCVCWIHYYVLSYLYSRLVWHSMCFVKDCMNKLFFNGSRCFIHYVFVVCDYWFKIPNQASQHELLIY
jgi:hypothetical protein